VTGPPDFSAVSADGDHECIYAEKSACNTICGSGRNNRDVMRREFTRLTFRSCAGATSVALRPSPRRGGALGIGQRFGARVIAHIGVGQFLLAFPASL